jgi:hypothetical protein
MTGVVATLETQRGGISRLVFEDAIRTSDPKGWNTIRLFTHVDFSDQNLDELTITKERLSEIGLILILRLMALHKTQGKASDR